MWKPAPVNPGCSDCAIRQSSNELNPRNTPHSAHAPSTPDLTTSWKYDARFNALSGRLWSFQPAIPPSVALSTSANKSRNRSGPIVAVAEQRVEMGLEVKPLVNLNLDLRQPKAVLLLQRDQTIRVAHCLITTAVPESRIA